MCTERTRCPGRGHGAGARRSVRAERSQVHGDVGNGGEGLKICLAQPERRRIV